MQVKERYRVDEVRYTDELPSHLRSLSTSSSPTLLLLEGPNTDSGKTARPAAFDGISEFRTDKTTLHHQMAECRVIKTEMELDVLRYASKISSLAHMHVMRTMKPGMKEYQAESTFLHHVYFYGEPDMCVTTVSQQLDSLELCFTMVTLELPMIRL